MIFSGSFYDQRSQPMSDFHWDSCNNSSNPIIVWLEQQKTLLSIMKCEVAVQWSLVSGSGLGSTQCYNVFTHLSHITNTFRLITHSETHQSLKYFLAFVLNTFTLCVLDTYKHSSSIQMLQLQPFDTKLTLCLIKFEAKYVELRSYIDTYLQTQCVKKEFRPKKCSSRGRLS